MGSADVANSAEDAGEQAKAFVEKLVALLLSHSGAEALVVTIKVARAKEDNAQG